MDNLDSHTYEVFEKDPVKYVEYEKVSTENNLVYFSVKAIALFLHERKLSSCSELEEM